jgi:hypothetical protein
MERNFIASLGALQHRPFFPGNRFFPERVFRETAFHDPVLKIVIFDSFNKPIQNPI